MIIKTFAETSYEGMFKLAPAEGPAFFVRKAYLVKVDFDSIEPDAEFNEEQEEELVDAGLACVAELKAVDYLARCEQSRFGLTRKLVEKQFDKKYIDMALTFLESKNYLSDERYSAAWLHSRGINHYEGRSKLKAELLKRGIDKAISDKAVEEYFTEKNEEEICLKAYEKFVKHGKSDDKLIAAMMNAGFSYKQIKAAKEMFEENNEA